MLWTACEDQKIEDHATRLASTAAGECVADVTRTPKPTTPAVQRAPHETE
jgi:hypothetical protein